MRNVCTLLQAAKQHNTEDLFRVCLQFIENNTQEAVQQEGFNYISEETLIDILKSDNLRIKEVGGV